ncbi:MAG TPA: flagellar protein FliT [Bacilli bacterium]
MDKLIGELEQITLQCIEEIEASTYEQLIDFVEQREQMIDRLKNQPAEAADKLKHQSAIQRILQYDAVIRVRMNKLKLEARVELDRISSGRKQKDRYSPSFNADAVFFDKKK